MATSRVIVTGEDYTPDDFNNLRNDVLDPISGHKHDNTDGGRVKFSSLDVVDASGAIAPANGSASYNDIANHVGGTGGQHGLNAGMYPIGAAAAAGLVQEGTESLSGTQKSVVFPIAYSSTPVVVVTMYTEPGTSALTYDEQGPWISARSASGFTVNTRLAYSSAAFGWMAVGAKNA